MRITLITSARAFTLIVLCLTYYAVSYANRPIHAFRLTNGLQVLVKEDHRAPVAVFMIWYRVGSADEPGGITGVSHALEHMMFKGSAKYPVGVFSKTIAAIGGQENAFTNSDYTAYFAKVSASQLPIVFALEADRMQNLLLDAEEFAKEIKVIREERRLRIDNNPQALTYERYLSTAHLAQPYQHPVIGWMTDLYRMNITDLKEWYQKFYAPNNATIVIVGDVVASSIQQLSQQYFGNIARKADYVRRIQMEPMSFGPKSVRIQRLAKLPMLMFGYTVPSLVTSKNTWEPYALELITGILNAGENARFAKNLIRSKQIASTADVYYDLYSHYQTQLVISAIPAQQHSLEELKGALLQELNRLKQELVTDDELRRIKTQLIAQKTFNKDSIFGQAMELGVITAVGLNWQVADAYSEQINNITPAQIQAVAQRYFKNIAETQALLIPIEHNKPKL